MISKILPGLILISIFYSCQPDRQTHRINKFSDRILVKIHDLKDRRLSDSLYKFLISENPEYRKEASLAFASIQDTLAIEHLGKLLIREKDSTVRMITAYALGQTRGSGSERIILGALIKEKDPQVLNELLKAYGSTTTRWQLIKPIYFHDSIFAEGLAWSIYRAGLNGKTDSTANRVAAELLTFKYNNSTRLGASHFFSRSALGFDKYFEVIKQSALNDSSVEVRMAATFALRKIKSPESLQTLIAIIGSKTDGRIRANAVRALQPFDFNDTKKILYNLLYEKNVNVAITASEVIKSGVSKDNWIELSNISARIQHWRIQANLYEAALLVSNNESLVEEVQTAYRQSINVYQKAALITALQNNLPSIDFLKDELLKADTPIIRTSAASALAKLNYQKDFTKALKLKYLEILKQAVRLGDPIVVGILSAPLADKTLVYKTIISDIDFLRKTRQELLLHQHFEAIEPLEAVIAYFEDRKPNPVQTVFQHPIDWSFVKTIARDQRVIVKTSRGQIILRLFVEESPGSVSNFLQLVHQNYFDSKLFHRVVPNFVIQAGCKRGDGSGSENYSIRSEITQRKYKTGSVGMASSGKDTEGTQWFITHSPSPHLEGRYTIFAEVVEGMEVVNLIEVGDRIHDVEVWK